MNRLTRLMGVGALIALLISSGPVSADIGGMLKACTGCHGEDGRGTDASVPIIAGAPATVQEDALFAYIDGDRNCGSNPMMCQIVMGLTEDQVVEAAEYFAAMPFVPAGEDFDPTLADAGQAIHQENCAICHGEDGPADAGASVLHGQRMGYLRYALQQYVSGERNQPPAMQKKVAALSSDDIEALLNYYASYTN